MYKGRSHLNLLPLADAVALIFAASLLVTALSYPIIGGLLVWGDRPTPPIIIGAAMSP